jgi:hypothetical protein
LLNVAVVDVLAGRDEDDDDTLVGVVVDDGTDAEDDKFNPLIVAVCELC